jgi:hypothetical protein
MIRLKKLLKLKIFMENLIFKHCGKLLNCGFASAGNRHWGMGLPNMNGKLIIRGLSADLDAQSLARLRNCSRPVT